MSSALPAASCEGTTHPIARVVRTRRRLRGSSFVQAMVATVVSSTLVIWITSYFYVVSPGGMVGVLTGQLMIAWLAIRYHTRCSPSARAADPDMLEIRDLNTGEILLVLDASEFPAADLRGRCLVRANFFGLDLSGANLARADLREARFGWTNLIEADLRGADLRGADLRQATLYGAQLDGVRWDASTQWPSRTTSGLARGRPRGAEVTPVSPSEGGSGELTGAELRT